MRQLDGLSPETQRRVLEFVNALALAQKKGTPGKRLLRFAGAISAEDARSMLQTVNECCEQVDADEW